jgi:hypothetical protein
LKVAEVPAVYAHKMAVLGDLEKLGEAGRVDLFYADESRVTVDPCIPYCWRPQKTDRHRLG